MIPSADRVVSILKSDIYFDVVPSVSPHYLIDLDLCLRVSVMVDCQIVSVQLRHQNSRHGVEGSWNLPDLPKTVRATQFKYVEGRDPCNVKASGCHIVNSVVGVSRARQTV